MMKVVQVRRAVAMVMVLLIGTVMGITVAVAGGKQPASPQTAERLQAKMASSDVRAFAPRIDVGVASARLYGDNRYETAAAISQFFWDYDSTITVNLITGDNWPDSLTLGASTGLLGPTLLVRRDTLPTATRAELARLRPCYVLAAGGTAVISPAVLREAERYANPAACDGF
jgi:putative cell wall-binding protein